MTDHLGGLVWELRRTENTPNIPFADGLRLEDFGNDPFFVELPLVQVGKTSANGEFWDDPAADNLVSQINDKRLEGIIGHVPKEQRAYRYDLPAVRWVGAKKLGDGRVWAKAYVGETRKDVRGYFEDAYRVKARVATSVYGLKGKKGLADTTFEQIDIGHPDRVANADSVAVPVIVRETTQEQTSMENELVAELRQQRSRLEEQVATLTKQRDEAKQELQALQATRDGDHQMVAELRQRGIVDSNADLVQFVTQTVEENRNLRVAAASALRSEVVSEMVKIEELRPTIAARLSQDAIDKNTIQREVTTLLEAADIKLLSEMVVKAKSGGRVVRNAGGQTKVTNPFDLEDTPERRAEAAARMGTPLL